MQRDPKLYINIKKVIPVALCAWLIMEFVGDEWDDCFERWVRNKPFRKVSKKSFTLIYINDDIQASFNEDIRYFRRTFSPNLVNYPIFKGWCDKTLYAQLHMERRKLVHVDPKERFFKVRPCWSHWVRLPKYCKNDFCSNEAPWGELDYCFSCK